jgi:hypothetical protein
MFYKHDGVVSTLAWSSFGNPKPGKAPGPGKSATAARTVTKSSPGRATVVLDKNSTPAVWVIRPTLSMTTSLTKGESFVMAWALNMPSPMPDDLLHHEQLHYDISALVARDALAAAALFIDASDGFKSETEARQALSKVMNAVFAQEKAIHKAYDDAVHPEQSKGITRGPEQLRWDGFIQSAKEDPRMPPIDWPVDGGSMMQTIYDATP